MNKLYIIMLCVLFVSPAFGKTITAAVPTWAPCVQAGEEMLGVSVEIVTEAFKTQGYRVDLKLMPWSRSLEELKSGRVDSSVAVWFTEERSTFLAYSEPYLENAVKFIKRRNDDFEYNGIESLNGKTVGVIRNYGYGDEFLNAKSFRKPASNDFVSNAKKLSAKRIDLTIEDELVAKYELAKAGFKVEDFSFTKNALSVNPLYMTVSLSIPQHAEYIEAFNKGLVEIRANGTYDEIMVRYGMK